MAMFKSLIKGFHHIGLPVTNIEASKTFYAQFGFVETMYEELPRGDDAVKVSMLELNGVVLELYQLISDDLEEIKGRTHGKIDHLALDVDDIEAIWKAVIEAGHTPLEEKPVFLPFWDKGMYYFNIIGPDGEKVEFTQRVR